jgi:hypothetical protein
VFDHRALLKLAMEIATPTQITEVALRRSASTTYYALFHFLMKLAADAICPEAGGSPDWVRVYRSLDHGPTSKRLHKVKEADQFPELISLRQIFADQLRIRHEADYNPGAFGETRISILNNIKQVAELIRRLDGLSNQQKLGIAVILLFEQRS